MKRLPISFFILAMAFFSSGSQAISLKFTLDIISSGPSIYACGAGIKHAEHRGGRICYDRESGESCSPDLCIDAEPCNCVCTGGVNGGIGGEERHDKLVATYAEWVDNGELLGEIRPIMRVATGSTNWSSTFQEQEKEEWGKVLNSLEFQLGSERYGAEMYLDVCYRGPQIEYYKYADQYANAGGDIGVMAPNHSFKAQATITDFSTTSQTYQELANLKVSMIATCDVQGMGEYVYASQNNDATEHTITGVTGGDKNFFVDFRDFNTSTQYLYDGWINLRNSNVPRFCKVRYVFKEARRDDADSLAQIRKWKLQKARVCTYTEINEPEESF